jgi:hypothetical protein
MAPPVKAGSAPTVEVRRCAGCGQAAAICVTEWQHVVAFG